MSKYYKATLCTCDQDLRCLKKGNINFINISKNIKYHNIDLVIKVEETGKSTELRINEEIPFLYFKKKPVRLKKGKIGYFLNAEVPEDYITTFAIAFEIDNPELTNEELENFMYIDGYKLESDIAIAKKIGNENLNKSEVHTKQMQKIMKIFD